MEHNQNADNVNSDDDTGDSLLDDMISQMYSQYDKLSAKGFPSVSSLSTGTTKDKANPQDLLENETTKQTPDPTTTTNDQQPDTKNFSISNPTNSSLQPDSNNQEDSIPSETPILFTQFLEKLLPSTDLSNDHKSALIEMSRSLGPQLEQLEQLFGSTTDEDLESMMNEAEGIFKDEKSGLNMDELSESSMLTEMAKFFNPEGEMTEFFNTVNK